MSLAAGHFPDKPGFDCTEEKLSSLSTLTGTRDIVENPANLRAAEICVYDETCFCTNHVLISVRPESVGVSRCSSALPHYCIADRLTGLLVPHNSRLTLVRNADGRNVSVA